MSHRSVWDSAGNAAGLLQGRQEQPGSVTRHQGQAAGAQPREPETQLHVTKPSTNPCWDVHSQRSIKDSLQTRHSNPAVSLGNQAALERSVPLCIALCRWTPGERSWVAGIETVLKGPRSELDPLVPSAPIMSVM